MATMGVKGLISEAELDCQCGPLRMWVVNMNSSSIQTS